MGRGRDHLQELVRSECARSAKDGVNIRYETRKDRAGYKAGNLKEGMRHSYLQGCEFVAMFDADFQPAPDFLVRTVPLLVRNPRLALVQARWEFGESCDKVTLYSVFFSASGRSKYVLLFSNFLLVCRH
jgi:beta-mannan synthase